MGTSIDEIIAGAETMFKTSNIVMRMNDKKKCKVPARPTGIPALDIALGVRGLPKGRIVEVFGPESSGKTTLVLKIIAQAQKEGAWVWYGDMEQSLDPDWSERQGVNMDKLLLSQPDHGNQCLDLAQYMVRTGVIDIIVIDSVSALVPEAELNGESGDAVMGLQARMMSQAMRRLTPATSRTECTAIFINQIREKIGVMFGSPETTSGGRALKFFSSVRIDIRKTGIIGTKEEVTGNMVKMKIVKNKVAPPFKICEALLSFEKGFDYGMNVLESGVDRDVIVKSGGWYNWGDTKLGHGKEAAVQELNNLSQEMQNKIYAEIVGGKPKESKPEDKLSDELKEKLAKYQKKLLESITDEEKEKYQKRIDKILSGDMTEETVEGIGIVQAVASE